MEFKDYYRTLGVSRDATADDIKKAFRKMARKYHPDVSKEPDAEARMKEINEANTVLSDPEKRAAYDQLGRGYRPGQEFRPPPDWDAGFEFSGRGFSPTEAADFSDFFAELFGRMGGGRGGFHAHGGDFRARGEDHYAKVVLDLEDAFTGATRQISLRVPKQDDARPASACHAHPQREDSQGRSRRSGHPPGRPGRAGHGRRARRATCCWRCTSSLTTVSAAEGRDLHLTLPVAPWEAALGAVVAVDLPDASLKVRIPQGAQSGRQLRVRGKGIPGNPPGDLLLDIQIVLPTADTPKARELYETMARELAFDPESLDPRRHGRT